MASLIFEHLKKVYPNGFVSVDDVSLSIEDGELLYHRTKRMRKIYNFTYDWRPGRYYFRKDLS